MTYKDWISKESLILLEGWARDGLTNEEIAKNIGINPCTLYEWKKEKTEISEALKRGREVSDYIIENELFQSAQTRTITVKKPIKVKTVKSDGKKRIEEERIEYVEEQIVLPANVTAQIFYLKNRKPSTWKDKREELIKTDFNDDIVLDIKGYLDANR